MVSRHKFLFFTLPMALLTAVGGTIFALQNSPAQSRTNAALLAKAPPAKKSAKKKMPVSNKPVCGVAFHFCSCSIPCSCIFNDKDVEGCNILKVYHYTDGGYIGKYIVNQTIVIVPHPKELQNLPDAPMTKGEPVNSVIYVPMGLTMQQENDLILPVMEMDMQLAFQKTIRRHANIVFHPTKTGYEVEIPGIFHVITQKALGVNHQQITADNLSASEGSHWLFGKTQLHTYQDKEQQEWKWSYPDKMGSWTFFHASPHSED